MNSADSAIRKPFIEHVYELRRRVLISVVAILAGGLLSYSVYKDLLHVIQKPLGQTLFYTSPAGGFSFVFKLCFVCGVVVALPIVVFQLLQFLNPLLKKITKRYIIFILLASVSLAGSGIAFAYFISLPAALHFLGNFGGQEIQSLITADAYFNFALAYLGGFAVLFQLPLLILLINRVSPLGPGPLMRIQRYVILFSFIVAAILTPTPDPINQALMAMPIILLYQISIILIWLVNLMKKSKKRPVANFEHTYLEHTRAAVPIPPTLSISIPAIGQKKFIDIMPQPLSAQKSNPSPKIGLEQPSVEPVSSVRFIDIVKTVPVLTQSTVRAKQ